MSTFLTSCNRCVDIRLFNNTGAEIVVSGFDPGGTTHTWTIANGESAIVWFMYRWEMHRLEKTWMYQPGAIEYPGVKFTQQNAFHCLHMAMQIEPNGSIWVLGPGSSTIATQLPDQPPGYPANPYKAKHNQP